MTVLTEEDIREMVARLEQQELDCQTGSGQVSVSVYCELMAAYLASSPPALLQAKFLWQRVPAASKEEEGGAELGRLWELGRQMWARDTAGVYRAMAGPWNFPQVCQVMDRLASALRQSHLRLVGEAYSSIQLDQLAAHLGMEQEEAAGMAEREGWTVDRGAGVVSPCRGKQGMLGHTSTEDQLDRIISFVSYLEN